GGAQLSLLGTVSVRRVGIARRWIVAGASGFRLTYTPNYAATLAVQRQAHRYHFSATQRYVWWLLPILQLSVLLAVIVWGENIKSVLPPFIHPIIVFWSPLIVFVVTSAAMWLFVCRWLARRLTARWLTQRKPRCRLHSRSCLIGCTGKAKMGADGSCGKRSSACLLLLRRSAF